MKYTQEEHFQCVDATSKSSHLSCRKHWIGTSTHFLHFLHNTCRSPYGRLLLILFAIDVRRHNHRRWFVDDNNPHLVSHHKSQHKNDSVKNSALSLAITSAYVHVRTVVSSVFQSIGVADAQCLLRRRSLPMIVHIQPLKFKTMPTCVGVGRFGARHCVYRQTFLHHIIAWSSPWR